MAAKKLSMKDWNSSMAISWKSTKLFCNILLESRSKKQCCCQFDDGLRTASCTKLYEIAVRRCMKCCTKSVFKPLREGILTAGPFENKGFRTCAGVRSGLYFLPHGEDELFQMSNWTGMRTVHKRGGMAQSVE